MHSLQSKILELSKSQNLATLTLREIGELAGDPHPQKIKHHLEQLAKKGLLVIDKNTKRIRPTSQQDASAQLLALPILGSANCGWAVTFAEERVEGYLRVSRNMLTRRSDGLFILRAAGNSMNRAQIGNPPQSIEDGDYVVVDKNDRDVKLGDYVLSIIDDCANIKKYTENEQGNIALISESSVDYPPIYIDDRDMEDLGSYMVNGKVVQVIKKPTFLKS